MEGDNPYVRSTDDLTESISSKSCCFSTEKRKQIFTLFSITSVLSIIHAIVLSFPEYTISYFYIPIVFGIVITLSWVIYGTLVLSDCIEPILRYKLRVIDIIMIPVAGIIVINTLSGFIVLLLGIKEMNNRYMVDFVYNDYIYTNIYIKNNATNSISPKEILYKLYHSYGSKFIYAAITTLSGIGAMIICFIVTCIYILIKIYRNFKYRYQPIDIDYFSEEDESSEYDNIMRGNNKYH